MINKDKQITVQIPKNHQKIKARVTTFEMFKVLLIDNHQLLKSASIFFQKRRIGVDQTFDEFNYTYFLCSCALWVTEQLIKKDFSLVC